MHSADVRLRQRLSPAQCARNAALAAAKPPVQQEEASRASHSHTRRVVGKYKLGRVLAGGDFDCRTRLCTHVVTGTAYVMRIYDKVELYKVSWMWQRVREAIQVQRLMPRHENILEMVECFETASSLYIVMHLFASINLTTLYAGVSGNLIWNAHAYCPSVEDEWCAEVADTCDDAAHRPQRPSYARSSRATQPYISYLGDPPANMPPDNGSSDEDNDEDGCGASGSDPVDAGGSRTSTAMTRLYFVQVVEALLHMHRHGVVHLGIAPDHVLVNQRGRVRLSNLVVCRFCGSSATGSSSSERTDSPRRRCGTARGACRDCRIREFRGTMQTVAPEVLTGQPYNPHLAESWSLGVLLYFMLHGGRYPHDSANSLMHIAHNRIKPPRSTLSPSAKDLLARLLQINPAERLPVEAILCHPFCRCSSALSRDKGRLARREPCLANVTSPTEVWGGDGGADPTHPRCTGRLGEPVDAPILSHSGHYGKKKKSRAGSATTMRRGARAGVSAEAVWSEEDRAILNAAMDYLATLPWTNDNASFHRQGALAPSLDISCVWNSFHHGNNHTYSSTNNNNNNNNHNNSGGSCAEMTVKAKMAECGGRGPLMMSSTMTSSHPYASCASMGSMLTNSCFWDISVVSDMPGCASSSVYAERAARVIQYYWRVRCHRRLYRCIHSVLVARAVDSPGAAVTPPCSVLASVTTGGTARASLLGLLRPCMYRHSHWSGSERKSHMNAPSNGGSSANMKSSLSAAPVSMVGSTLGGALSPRPLSTAVSFNRDTSFRPASRQAVGRSILVDASTAYTPRAMSKPYLHTPYEYSNGAFRNTAEDS